MNRNSILFKTLVLLSFSLLIQNVFAGKLANGSSDAGSTKTIESAYRYIFLNNKISLKRSSCFHMKTPLETD